MRGGHPSPVSNFGSFSFGPFMRFVVKHPSSQVISNRLFVVFERMFETLDKRYFSVFQTKAKTSLKLRNKHIEVLTIKIVSRLLKF
jgi:hypothetical protein